MTTAPPATMNTPRTTTTPRTPANGRTRGGAVWLAPISAMLLPVRTVRRADDAKLYQAWLVHLPGLIAGFVLLVAVAIEPTPGVSWWGEFAYFWTHDLPHTFASDNGAWAQAASIFVSLEAVSVLLAWVFMAWAARPGPIRRSVYTRSLGRIWLITPHLALIIPAAILVYELLGIHSRHARYMPSQPTAWYQRPEMSALIFAASCLWAVVVLLRVTATGRWRAHCVWPAMCEQCGYSLTGLPVSGACPECGRPCRESLDQSPRRGPLWETVGGWSLPAWARTAGQAIRWPTGLGEQLRLLWPDMAHARFLAITLALSAALGAAGLPACMAVPQWLDSSGYPWPDPFYLIVMIVMSAFTGVMVVLLLTLAAASLMGGIQYRLTKRNLLPAAIRAACYLGGYLLLWHLLFWIVWLITLVLDSGGVLASLARWFNTNPGAVVSLSWLVVHALAGAGFLVLLWRAVTPTRHANR